MTNISFDLESQMFNLQSENFTLVLSEIKMQIPTQPENIPNRTLSKN